MIVFAIGISVILAGGLATLLFPDQWKGWILAGSLLIGSCSLIGAALPVLLGTSSRTGDVMMAAPIGNVQFIIDPLSAFFVLLIAVMSPLGVVYGIGYLRPYCGQQRNLASHYVFLSVLIAAMLGVVVVRNALAFLIVWEIMSLSSFFLVIFDHEREDVLKAGLNYLIAMHIGVCFLISGFALLMLTSGSADFASFAPILQANSTFAAITFLLLFAGFGMKAGFLPLHSWLPQAHPAAPSHVSGMMSGIMIKTGIYGILRMLTVMPTPPLWLSLVILSIAVLSAMFGVMYAIAQHDVKKLLAYHSVENIGIIGIGIGMGMIGLSTQNPLVAVLGFAGGLLHVLNHSIFKMLLFYGAGAVYQQTHTRNIEELGGLAQRMKLTSICFLIGSLAISGLPVFNGFISEFLVYLSMFHSMTLHSVFISVVALMTITLLAFVGGMAFLCFTKVFGIVFLGTPRTIQAQQAQEVGKVMLLPMGILSALAVVIGIFPQYVVSWLKYPVLVLVKLPLPVTFPEMDVFTTISTFCLGVLFLSLLLYGFRAFLLQRQQVSAYKTWDCGYQAGNSRMQYTGSSYAESFLWLVKPFVHVNRQVEQPTGLFPKQAHFESHTQDPVDAFGLHPVITGMNRFLGLFSWIQSGSTQKYILYGCIFLLITLAVVFGLD